MRAAIVSRRVLAHDLLHRRHHHHPRARPRPHPDFFSNLQTTLGVVDSKLANMPGSLARKERRRKEREGNVTPVMRVPRAVYAESIDNQVEATLGGAERQSAHQVLASDGQGALVQGRAYQKQSKSRSKRGPAPRVPRECEPPSGSLAALPPSVYEEALRQLRNMTPDQTARLKQTVMDQMGAEGFCVPAASPLNGAQGVSIPIGSITAPVRAPSSRDKDIMTRHEAEDLRQALFEKLDVPSDLVHWPGPMATPVKEPNAEASLVSQTSGTLDGASQSAGLVLVEQEQACVAVQTSSHKRAANETKVQAQLGSSKLRPVPCCVQ